MSNVGKPKKQLLYEKNESRKRTGPSGTTFSASFDALAMDGRVSL